MLAILICQLRFTFLQVDSEFELAYGVSCSTPVSGAIFTMINDARIAASKSATYRIHQPDDGAPANTAHHDETFPVDLFPSVCLHLERHHNPRCGTNGSNATIAWAL